MVRNLHLFYTSTYYKNGHTYNNTLLSVLIVVYTCATVCPRSLDQFYRVTYYMKWVKTS